MSKLTDILHEFADAVGRGALHGAIDELDRETTPKDEVKETETDVAE
jgi:hypothetical protein